MSIKVSLVFSLLVFFNFSIASAEEVFNPLFGPEGESLDINGDGKLHISEVLGGWAPTLLYAMTYHTEVDENDAKYTRNLIENFIGSLDINSDNYITKSEIGSDVGQKKVSIFMKEYKEYQKNLEPYKSNIIIADDQIK